MMPVACWPCVSYENPLVVTLVAGSNPFSHLPAGDEFGVNGKDSSMGLTWEQNLRSRPGLLSLSLCPSGCSGVRHRVREVLIFAVLVQGGWALVGSSRRT